MKYLIIIGVLLISLFTFVACQGTKQVSPEEQARIQALELYEKARQLEAQKDYFGAKECYEKSLDLHEDDKVQAAYLKLMSTIGPM